MKYLKLKKEIDSRWANVEIDDSQDMEDKLSTLTDELLDDAFVTDNEASHRLENIASSNIASVDREDQHQGSAAVFVTSEVQPPALSGAAILEAAQRAIKADKVAIQVDDEAVDEFSANDTFWLDGFPHLFLLGEGVDPESGTIKRKDIEHFLYQYDGRFARSAPFLFALFNQMQRHAVATKVSLRVKGHDENVQHFSDLVNKEDFVTKLKDCLENPDSKEAVSLGERLTKLTSICGSEVPWSPAQRHSALPRIIAHMHYSGPPCFYVTVSPCDMDSLLMLRFSSPDTKFNDGKDDIMLKLPCKKNRLQLLKENPVIAGIVYDRLIRYFFEDLIGLKPVHITRTNVPPVMRRAQGVLGVPLAFVAVTEEQNRNSPHFHSIIWTDLSPIGLQACLKNDNLQKRFIAKLDVLIRAYLLNPTDSKSESQSTDAASQQQTDEQSTVPMSTLDCEEPTPRFRDHRNTVPLPTTQQDADAFEAIGVSNASQTNLHGKHLPFPVNILLFVLLFLNFASSDYRCNSRPHYRYLLYADAHRCLF